MSQRLCWAVAVALLGGAAAQAAPVGIDGIRAAGEYGAFTSVAYDPAAPDSNFGAPTNASRYVAYDIYLKSVDGFVVGLLQAKPSEGGASAGQFANLYFDLDSATRSGSDLGFELGAGSQRAFIPGGSGPVVQNDIVVAASGDGLVVEFAIPTSSFTAPLPGLTYNAALTFPGDGGVLRLNLSQSFGYSVAGGASYGASRLGVVVLDAATDVPEPATVALLGFGLLGLAALRRQV